MTLVSTYAPRVAVLAPTRHPLREPFAGGQEACAAGLARALVAAGCEVTLHAPAGSDFSGVTHAAPYAVPRLSREAALDVTCPRSEVLTDHHATVAAMRHSAAEVAAGRLDVVHDHTLSELPLVLAEALAVPLVKVLHTPPFSWLESAAQLCASGVEFVAVTEALAAAWTTLPRPARVVLNGVDEEVFASGQGGPHVLWAGRLVPEKAPHLAVEAALGAGLPLRVAGPSDGGAYARRLLSTLGAEPSACWLGHLTSSELAEQYAAAGVTLLTPQWAEPFGLVAAESALCGTPVVGLRAGGLPEVVREGVTGHLVDDPRDLPAALRAALLLPRADVLRDARARLTRAGQVGGMLGVTADLLGAVGRRDAGGLDAA